MKSRPCVLLILDKMLRAGTQRHILHLLKGLKDEWDFHVVSLEGRGPWDNKIKALGNLQHIYSLHRIYDFSGLQTVSNLSFLIRQLKPVGIETFMFTAHLCGSLAARLSNDIPLISSRREKTLWRKKRHFMFRKLANKAVHYHIANSQAVADDIVDYENVKTEKISVIPNGLDWDDYKNQKKIIFKDKKIHIAVVAALKEVKNHQILIRSVEQYRNELQNTVFHFIGEGPYKNKLQEQIQNCRLEDHFSFEGHWDPVAPKLCSFDYFVLPSKSEGLSNAIIEALGAGLPVIAFDVDGNKELVDNDVTGFLIENNNESKMGEALVRLTKNVDLRKQMSQRAYEHARDQYSLEKVCQMKSEIYHKVFKC